VDTVDNTLSFPGNRRNQPPADDMRPSDRAPSAPPVHNPEEGEPSTTSRGADLARDALRAAREVTARRRAQAGAPTAGAGRRGRRRRWSGPGPDDRDPQRFGRIVSHVAAQRGWSPRLTDASVLGRWPQIAGPEIAGHCTPVSLRDGELVLRAESTAWATQLRQLQRQLLATLAAAVGDGVVRRITVVGPSGPTWRHGLRHVRGRGPRDTYG